MKNKQKQLLVAAGFLLAFTLWTVLVCIVDVKAIGPRDSTIGFATMNEFVHKLFGVHMTLYMVTDWLGLVPVAFGLGFAVLGLIQWIKRKDIRLVDRSILVLGGFYIVVITAYLMFESITINYRPVLIAGYLERSYPSSTTMLVLCVMTTAMMQLRALIKNRTFNRCVVISIAAFTAFMVFCRLVSGVHWLSDIIGGVLLSTGLVMLYRVLSDV